MYKAKLYKNTPAEVDVAVKMTKKMTKEGRTEVFEESKMLSQLVHPNIVRLFGIVTGGFGRTCWYRNRHNTQHICTLCFR